jgi:hypothetical protein
LLHYPGPVDVTKLPVVPTTICSTSLTSFSPFAIVQPVVDTTPPTLTVNHQATGANGWNVAGPVTVSIAASDSGSGLAGSPSCTDTYNGSTSALTVAASATTVTGDGTHVVTCTVSDLAGNGPVSASDTVRLDTIAPVVAYAGNANPSYTVGQTISITCSASDGGSGIASTTCANVSGPASGFLLGTNTLSADATDQAGNIGHGSTSFTVSPAAPAPFTIVDLCQRTLTYIQSSARYAALPAFWQNVLAALAGATCRSTSSVFLHMTTKQRAAYIQAYQLEMRSLASLGWLTQAQANTLIALSATL